MRGDVRRAVKRGLEKGERGFDGLLTRKLGIWI